MLKKKNINENRIESISHNSQTSHNNEKSQNIPESQNSPVSGSVSYSCDQKESYIGKDTGYDTNIDDKIKNYVDSIIDNAMIDIISAINCKLVDICNRVEKLSDVVYGRPN
jgi:hypothetical protein